MDNQSNAKRNGDLINTEEFFAPATTSWLDAMMARYEKEKDAIGKVADFMTSPDVNTALDHFSLAMQIESRTYVSCLAKMFKPEMAIKSLNAKYWSEALKLTDVMDYMPKKKRDEWNKQIREIDVPEFEEESVRATLTSLMNQRMDFLAEMVDGIFTGLSGEHVTNRPEGFGKRMIIDNVYNMYYEGHKAGLIHDMRSVIAKFRGLERPAVGSTSEMLRRIKSKRAVWHIVDGGAFRIKVFKVGTAHLEINPDISHRLNQILAYLHPMAIPQPHRRRPNKKAARNFTMIHNVIPQSVLAQIAGKRWTDERTLDMGFQWGKNVDKHIRKQVNNVMEAIGGVQGALYTYQFDYDAKEVVDEILTSGMLPDQQSHQYYPTPGKLANIAIDMADINENDTILEPSAGQGAIAALLPEQQTTCVEINHLNCKVLETKGITHVINADFMKWKGDLFSKVILNPPYSENRWITHTQKAFDHLNVGGKLVAILPATAMNKAPLSTQNAEIKFSNVYRDEFDGTSISIVIMEANKNV